MSTQTLRLVAIETPVVVRRCPGCDVQRKFRSSERFRVNAQKKKLDVWLIYRCEVCSATYNATVIERANPRTICPERLHRFHTNDPETAREVAFEHPQAEPVQYRMEGQLELVAGMVQLELRGPIDVRLDRLLAHALGVSRSMAAQWVDDRRALRKRAKDGQRIELRSPPSAS